MEFLHAEILDSLADAAYVQDTDGTFITINKAAVEMYGYEKEEVIGKPPAFLSAPGKNNLDEISRKIDKAAAGEPQQFEFWGRSKNGDIFPKDVRISLGTFAGESVIIAIARNISNRKKAEQNLIDSERRLRTFFNLSSEGIVITDETGRIVDANPRVGEMLGYTPAEMIGKKPTEFVTEKSKSILTQNMATDSEQPYEVVGVRKDGTTVPMQIKGKSYIQSNKKYRAANILDITKQKETEAFLKQTRANYHRLIESIGVIIWRAELESREVLFVNKEAEAILGLPTNEWTLNSEFWKNHVHPADLEQLLATFEQLAETREPCEVEFRMVSAYGEIVWLRNIMRVVEYANLPDEMIGVMVDITDRKQAELESLRNEELLSQLFDNAPIGIALMDSNNKVTRINKGFTDIFGYTREEALNRNINKLLMPDGLTDEDNEISTISYQGDSIQEESVRLHKNGDPLDVLIAGVPVVVHGETLAVYGIYVDVTKRKTAEKQLRNSLNEKKTLLSEIHHRVKNNMALVVALLELQAFKTTDKELKQMLSDTQSRIQSMAMVHEQLYKQETFTEIDLGRYLEELHTKVKYIHTNGRSSIDCEIHTNGETLSMPQAVPCGLLINELLQNCYTHAFPNGRDGNICIKVISEDHRITIHITDNGVGLPDDFDIEHQQTLGTILIRMLIKQLEADYSLNTSDEGTFFSFSFDKN